MNKKNKFRGKTLNGEWLYGYLEYDRQNNIARIHTYNKDGRYEGQKIVDAETEGQFTGLYDIHGKEIYEGDILQLGNSPSGVCEVKWNEFIAAFCIRFSFEGELGSRPLGKWLQYEKSIEIIGNIHDNPELLKGGEK